jgi:hypothetical protein
MKIELSNPQKKEVLSFPNMGKIVVGRKADADIKLEGSDISREHLHILYKDGRAYIVDQGSTCGVFINNDRVAAFREVEFTTFFPVQLGLEHFITLISLDDGKDNKPLKIELDFKDHSRSYKNYKAKAVVRRKPKKEEPETSNLAKLVVVLILAGIAYYFTKFQ